MDPQSMQQLESKLQRLNTHESSTDSLFSRNDSSSSVTTQIASPRGLVKSLSSTKIHDDSALSIDALSRALHAETGLRSEPLSGVSSNGQPRSANNLTTTPANEPQEAAKWCIVLVGLPACGKSSICRHLIEDTAKLNEFIHDFKIDSFNAGNVRRQKSAFQTQSQNFFDFNNEDAKRQREEYAHIALEHLLNSLINSQINVGIFDATNSTHARRQSIFESIKDKERRTGEKINTLILHVKCTDRLLWRYNVEGKTKGPDYKDKPYKEAIADFISRADRYRAAFEPISDEELKEYEGTVYVEVDNAGRDINICKNGFKEDDDLVLNEVVDFMNDYYEKYGTDYTNQVEAFWSKNADKLT